MLTQYYQQPNLDVNGRRRYIPRAEQSGLGFRSAYGVSPAPDAPSAQAVALQLAAAACLNAMAGVNARCRWVNAYERGGRTVKGHWRARRVNRRIDDSAVEAQCAEYDALHAGA